MKLSISKIVLLLAFLASSAPGQFISGGSSNTILRGGIAPGYTVAGQPGVTNGTIRWNPAVTGLQYFVDGIWTNIGTGTGSGMGSLRGIYGPTNSAGAIGEATNVSTLTFSNGPNVKLLLVPDGSNAVLKVEATSSIQGPQGNDGLGNVWVAGAYFDGLVTATQGATIASYGGQVWITTNTGFVAAGDPALDPRWGIWIASGRDGTAGLSLSLVAYTNGMAVSTNNIFTYDGQLLQPKINFPGGSPAPILSGITNYNILVARGVDGSTNSSLSSVTWAGNFSIYSAYPSNSVVRYGLCLWIATTNVAAVVSGGPVPGSPGWAEWICDGISIPGADGADAIGNFLYVTWFDPMKEFYPSNAIASFTDRSTNKKNLYRALVNMGAGNYPDMGGPWEEIISSGEDADVLQWTFYPSYGPYTLYSNSLVRHNGVVYYTKQAMAISGIEPPNGTYWGVFVYDGTQMASNLVFRGAWSPAGTYSSNDLVAYAGSSWAAKANGVTNVPATNAAEWIQFTSIGAPGPMGPASTNITYQTIITNVTIIQTQLLLQVTNITYGTNFVTEYNTYSTNIVNEVTEYTTNGVRQIIAFGVTNDTPLGFRIVKGTNYSHSVDFYHYSTITIDTNAGVANAALGLVPVYTNNDYAARAYDFVVADSSSSDVKVMLPKASACTGAVVVVRKATAANIVYVYSTQDVVQGHSTVGVTRAGSVMEAVSDGTTNWWLK